MYKAWLDKWFAWRSLALGSCIAALMTPISGLAQIGGIANAGIVVGESLIDEGLLGILGIPQQQRLNGTVIASRRDGGPPCNLYTGSETKASQCLYDFLLKNSQIAKVKFTILSSAHHQRMMGANLDQKWLEAAIRAEMDLLATQYKKAIATGVQNGYDQLQRRVVLGSMIGASSVSDDLAAMLQARSTALFAANKEQAAYLFQAYSLLSRAGAQGSRAVAADAKALLLRLPFSLNVTENSGEGRQGWGIERWLESTWDPGPVLDLLVSDKTFASRYRPLLPRLLALQSIQGRQPYISLSAEQLIGIANPDTLQDRGLEVLSTAILYGRVLRSSSVDRYAFQSTLAARLVKSLDAVETSMRTEPKPWLSLETIALVRTWAKALYLGGLPGDVERVHKAWWTAAEKAQVTNWRYLALIAADLGAVEKVRMAAHALRHSPFGISDPTIWFYMGRVGGTQAVIDAFYAPTPATRFTKPLQASADIAMQQMAAALSVTPEWTVTGRSPSQANDPDACPIRPPSLPLTPYVPATTKAQCSKPLQAAADAMAKARQAAVVLRDRSCRVLLETTRAELEDDAEFNGKTTAAMHAIGEVIVRNMMLIGAAMDVPATVLAQALSGGLLLNDSFEYVRKQDEARGLIAKWQLYPDHRLQRFRNVMDDQRVASDNFKSSLTQVQQSLSAMQAQGCP